MYSAPIPGQSLTNEPKNAPWENPPQFADPADALDFHMEKLEKPRNIKATIGLLELGLDVVTMTQGILRNGVVEGRHSIDVSLLIAPIIHEYIIGIAKAAGAEYKEGFDEVDLPDQEQIDYSKRKKEAEKILKDLKGNKKVDFTPMEDSLGSPVMPEEEATQDVAQEELMMKQPKGLMSRRTT